MPYLKSLLKTAGSTIAKNPKTSVGLAGLLGLIGADQMTKPSVTSNQGMSNYTDELGNSYSANNGGTTSLGGVIKTPQFTPMPTSNTQAPAQQATPTVNPMAQPATDTQLTTPTVATQPTRDPVQEFYRLRAQQMQDKVNGTGLYSIDPNKPLSPQGVLQHVKNADDYYQQQLTGLQQEHQDSLDQESKTGKAQNQLTDNERGLMTSFVNQPEVKNYATILTKANSVNSILDKGLGGPGDLAVVYEFMKALDPTSVVRETEYDNAAKSGNIFQGYMAKFNGYFNPNGGILPDNVKKGFASIVESKLSQQRATYDTIKSQYEQIARNSGLNPQNVIIDYSKTPTYKSTPPSGFDTQEFYKKAKAAGKSDQEISDYLKAKGLSFNQVGNTVASVSIPKDSRLAYVNNNPGNLRFANQDGAVPGQGGFARFNSPEEGVRALQNQVALDASRGHTLDSFISKYAPPRENDTRKYKQQAVATLGYPVNTPISQIPLNDLVKFIARKESSTKIG